MSKIGFLHTSPVHVPTFNGLVDELLPDTAAVHQVDAGLLELARERGMADREVRAGVTKHLESLKSAGVHTIVCTCSTLGDFAESSADVIGMTIKRVDRPMVARAVGTGRNVLMAAALASTLDLSADLIRNEAARQQREVVIDTLHCDKAWPFFEADDMPGYHAEIARAIRTHLSQTTIPPQTIILAQATMAGAAELLTDLELPILSSPRSCIESLAK